MFLIANIATTSKALVTSSDALVPSSLGIGNLTMWSGPSGQQRPIAFARFVGAPAIAKGLCSFPRKRKDKERIKGKVRSSEEGKGRARTLLGAPGLTTRQEATRGYWHLVRKKLF